MSQGGYDETLAGYDENYSSPIIMEVGNGFPQDLFPLQNGSFSTSMIGRKGSWINLKLNFHVIGDDQATWMSREGS